jgi:hypothetical protein
VNITFNPIRTIFKGLIIEQLDIDTHRLYSYKTDANGIVEIPCYKYKLFVNNFLDSQSILINIDTIDLAERKNGSLFDAVILYSKEGDLFYRIDPNYKAGKITSYPYPLDSKQHYQLEKTKPFYTEIFNEHIIPFLTDKELKIEPRSFFCEHEEFEFYLERFVEPAVSDTIIQNVGKGCSVWLSQ